jgi:predicted DNA-binding ribbon-helix-helix protein
MKRKSSQIISMRIPTAFYFELQELAAKRGQSVAELARKLVIASIETNEATARLETAVQNQMKVEMAVLRETVGEVLRQAIARVSRS